VAGGRWKVATSFLRCCFENSRWFGVVVGRRRSTGVSPVNAVRRVDVRVGLSRSATSPLRPCLSISIIGGTPMVRNFHPLRVTRSVMFNFVFDLDVGFVS